MPTGFLARRPVPSFRSEFLEAATEVALFDSCVVCFKGDTVTGLALAEFAMGSLVAMGVPYEQAVATVQLSCADLYDVPLGASRRSIAVRACAECARRAGLAVGRLPDPALPTARVAHAAPRIDPRARSALAGGVTPPRGPPTRDVAVSQTESAR